MFTTYILFTTTILLTICINESLQSTVSFKGSEYIEYKIPDTSSLVSRKDKVSLRFKTTEAFGLLLYSCGEQGDFLLLEIKRGKIVYTGNFGSSIDQSGTHQLILNDQYNDDKWHDVILSRENGTLVSLTVDDVTRKKDTGLDFEQLNLDTFLYVGGFGERQRLDTSCHNNVGKKNFIGCLENVFFNSIHLLYGAVEQLSAYKVYGTLEQNCPANQYNIFGFNTEKSLLKVQRNILKQSVFEFSIELRTFEPNGHIATHLCTTGAVDLDQINGKVRLTLSFLGLTTNNAIRIESTNQINDGDWHVIRVVINRNESLVSMEIDKEKQHYKSSEHFKLSSELGQFMSSIRFGGNTPSLPGLVACFRFINIDEKKILFNSKDVEFKKDISNQCQIKDLCFPNPCQHGSTCTQSRQKAYCNCKNTDYKGAQCETCIHKRTCQEIKESGETLSGTYKICPNNENIFRVYCNMGSGATILKHNTANDTRVGAGLQMGTSRSQFYFHEIHYFVQISNIVELLKVSQSCQQYIRFDCSNSRLLFDVGKFRNVHYKGARWVSRDSVVQHYWGGATAESRKCGCGIDRSCAKDRKGNIKDCNCDVGDSEWRFDAGFLTDKNKLPVTQVQFSKGPETNENSFFTVGELKCYGTIPKPTEKPLDITTNPSVGDIIQPSNLDPSMFHNQTHHSKNKTFIVEKVEAESISSLFSKPWLVTIVIIGALLCLLLVFLVFLLFRQPLNDIFMKCIYGGHVSKPRIEIEDYNRYSTATEDQSDWDIYRLSTTFPTSTPEPSYGPTDDESAIGMRVRTLEDIRGKRRFKRLSGWGSRTASAPTVVGGSKQSLNDKYENFTYQKDRNIISGSSQAYQTSSESKPVSSPCHSLSNDTEAAYSTTATDGEVDSVIDDTNSEFSQPSQASSMKESECTLSPCSRSKQSHKQSNTEQCERPKKLCLNQDNCNNKINAVHLPKNSVKAYYPVVPVNGYRQSVVRRAHPVEYGAHVQMINNNGGRCQLPNGSVTRLVPVNRRTSIGGSDSYPLYTHSTIQEHSEELSDGDDVIDDVISYENARNSDGFYEMYEPEHGSPNSETRLLFDDVSSREECEREADEQIKLLKKKVIEKATSADECP